jgi:hypothetical protein
VQIAPTTATLGPGQTLQFQLADNLGTLAALWSVNPAVGSISASGLYTAPATLASNQIVTITATDAANAARSSTATITLVGPPPTLLSISPSVAGKAQSVAVVLTGTNFFAGSTVSTGYPGVTVSGVSIVSPTQIAATIKVAANAAPGTASITVSTSAGTSGAVAFSIVRGGGHK